MMEKMKKVFKEILIWLLAAVLTLIFSFSGFAEAETRVPENLYPTCGIVTEVNYTENMVTFTDFNGNSWSFYGTEDWIAGDIASAIMDKMGTDIIYDDEVLSVRYCGYIS